MTPPLLTRLLAAAAAAALLALPAAAQDAPAADEIDAEEPATEDPAAEELDAEEPAAAETESEAVPEAPVTEPSAAGGAAGAGEATGEAGTDEPAEPEVIEIVRETHGDWEVRCLPDGSECFLYQLAADQTDNPVAEFSMVKLPAGSEAAAGVTVVTPLGTLLPAGVIVQIDTGEARQYDFTFCSQVGCFARFGLTTDSINAMKRGRSARLQLVSIGAPEEPVSLDLSLIGFTAAFDSLEAPAAAPAPTE